MTLNLKISQFDLKIWFSHKISIFFTPLTAIRLFLSKAKWSYVALFRSSKYKTSLLRIFFSWTFSKTLQNAAYILLPIVDKRKNAKILKPAKKENLRIFLPLEFFVKSVKANSKSKTCLNSHKSKKCQKMQFFKFLFTKCDFT